MVGTSAASMMLELNSFHSSAVTPNLKSRESYGKPEGRASVFVGMRMRWRTGRGSSFAKEILRKEGV